MMISDGFNQEVLKLWVREQLHLWKCMYLPRIRAGMCKIRPLNSILLLLILSEEKQTVLKSNILVQSMTLNTFIECDTRF